MSFSYGCFVECTTFCTFCVPLPGHNTGPRRSPVREHPARIRLPRHKHKDGHHHNRRRHRTDHAQGKPCYIIIPFHRHPPNRSWYIRVEAANPLSRYKNPIFPDFPASLYDTSLSSSSMIADTSVAPRGKAQRRCRTFFISPGVRPAMPLTLRASASDR